jgi:hypothetical protein
LSNQEKSLLVAGVKQVALCLTTTLSTEIVDDLFEQKTCQKRKNLLPTFSRRI